LFFFLNKPQDYKMTMWLQWTPKLGRK